MRYHDINATEVYCQNLKSLINWNSQTQNWAALVLENLSDIFSLISLRNFWKINEIWRKYLENGIEEVMYKTPQL